MRDPSEQARSFWLPEQAFGHLKRRRRAVSQYSGDVISPLATVGIDVGGQRVHPGEGRPWPGSTTAGSSPAKRGRLSR